MNFEDLDLADLIGATLACFKLQAKAKSIKLRNEARKEFPVHADREKVEKILFNLISNAIKFTPEHGEVSVSVGVDEQEKKAFISVKDSGVGIGEDQRDCLFKEFRQIEESPQRSLDGVRLGLAIAKELVHIQRRRIWVESEMGKGSNFTFTLPISEVNSMMS